MADDDKGRRLCNHWLAECLILGWEAEQLPALRAVWWEHHDEQGNTKNPTEGVRLMDGVITRARAIVAQAARQPGVPLPIPNDLAEQLRASVAAESRDAILEIRQRERRCIDGVTSDRAFTEAAFAGCAETQSKVEEIGRRGDVAAEKFGLDADGVASVDGGK